MRFHDHPPDYGCYAGHILSILSKYLDILYASGNCYGQDNYPVRLEREDIRTIVKQCL